MADRTTTAPFVDRLENTRSSIRRFQVLSGGCWVALALGGGLAALAAADYAFELSWDARAVGLGLAAGAALVAAAVGILVPVLWWSRPRTAVEIEGRFPQLGQRVRTIVQFSGRRPAAVEAEGVIPNLVTALEEETDARARPLDLRQVIPWWKFRAAAVLAGVPILLLVGALFDAELRLAVSRALLGDRPYTSLAVAPGDVLVDEGDDVALSIELAGRVDRPVVVYSRRADKEGAAWQERQLPADDAKRIADDRAEYTTTLAKVTHPIQYRVEAGPAESELYLVTVRYPMAIEKFEARLTPPAYTGMKPETVAGGDLEVIEGTRVEFQVRFDRPCAEAFLAFTDPPYADRPDEAEPPVTHVPLEPGDGVFAAELAFAGDKLYSLQARARDGRSLPEKSYRVRVRRDRPPRVRFEDPGEALEVHPIAEVLMRIRAADDFGLSKAGVVFQVNNGDEQTLLVEEFPPPTGREEKSDDLALASRAICEKMLLLEDHNLTPTDSITYYAFAEDNFPGGARRTETDLRFIDVRPFKRIYKVGGT